MNKALLAALVGVLAMGLGIGAGWAWDTIRGDGADAPTATPDASVGAAPASS
ncbi:hypothetical protein QQX09_11030 [Demequina sp. SYSU T00192]|uniref:Uncharacterized protein n=1 Tax=Demequina litoralis TaxID=3051660 RepID=A0ABT8GCJ8_9MICO|nr:hypothetical protein [Demequina sp. SYSU T00192]MDN4476389.1 hypothetical protein [Demequina sp. SYSU T00192]